MRRRRSEDWMRKFQRLDDARGELRNDRQALGALCLFGAAALSLAGAALATMGFIEERLPVLIGFALIGLVNAGYTFHRGRQLWKIKNPDCNRG